MKVLNYLGERYFLKTRSEHIDMNEVNMNKEMIKLAINDIEGKIRSYRSLLLKKQHELLEAEGFTITDHVEDGFISVSVYEKGDFLTIDADHAIEYLEEHESENKNPAAAGGK